MNKKLKRHDPLYLQLAGILERQIRDGRYPAGSYLPSIRAVAREQEVTAIVVRSALKHLEKRNLVRLERGRGTRVVRVPAATHRLELLFAKWLSPFADALFSNFCEGVAEAARENEQSLLLSHISEEQDLEKHLRRLELPQADGLIVAGAPTFYGRVIAELEQLLPCVLAGVPTGAERADVLEPDLAGACALAVDHLRAAGFGRVLLIALNAKSGLEPENRFIAQFETFLRDAVYPGIAIWVQPNDTPREQRWAYRSEQGNPSPNWWLHKDLFRRFTPPIGIVTTGPSFAVQAAALARETGLRIPDEVAIVSLQDSTVLPLQATPISGVGLMTREAGMRAVRMLVQRLEHPDKPRCVEPLPPTLTIRESSRAAGQAVS
ncbi:MAG: GntR family transcriptional regulator [Kiritimatiellae bacterium]|nr:GntR family transcriptional regulator [Kiritimatiellia bacterium]